MRRALTSPLLLIACFVAALAAMDFSFSHLLLPLENRVSDRFVRIHASGLQADPDIVIVDIDDRSLARMIDVAGSWPWPRSVHGELAEGIARQHPRAIVFDILFAEPDVYRPESDALLNQALRQAPNTYFPMVRRSPSEDAGGIPLAEYASALGIAPTPAARRDARVALILPLAVAKENWRAGTINFVEDRDGIGRRYNVYTEAYGWRIPSLPARVVRDLGYPLPDRESIVLGWRGGALSHTRVSYADVYEDLERKKPLRDPEEFRGKIVIVGTTATGLHDIRATPLSSLAPAVEILATALDNLKNGGYMRTVPAPAPFALALLLVTALCAAFLARRNTLAIGAALLPLSAILLGAEYAALSRQLLLPVAAPLVFAWAFYFAAALLEYLRERREREKTVQIFNRFLDPRVVKELVSHGTTTESISGQAREITVLFSDIRGFTTLSEIHTPAEIVALLNRYFSMQVEVIFRHGGTLDKFIGDAIMAFWGAPGEDAAQAEHAIAAALEMADTLDRFRQEIGAMGATFDVGIGIHSGPAVVGFIGSEQRQDYTAIGDTVNLASRIEGQTKGIGRILVSADTMARCPGALEFIDHGLFKVKGRTQEVQLFEPKRKIG
ncbi:MAG: adenylate/guanylate cyclase domain-containing protein [Sulfuricella sp.]|nr:adenylate/guanylate cyclase domain-containing protein [Sulfuricella sp.]